MYACIVHVPVFIVFLSVQKDRLTPELQALRTVSTVIKGPPHRMQIVDWCVLHSTRPLFHKTSSLLLNRLLI